MPGRGSLISVDELKDLIASAFKELRVALIEKDIITYDKLGDFNYYVDKIDKAIIELK